MHEEFNKLVHDSQQMSAEELCHRYGLGQPTPENLKSAEEHRKRNLAFTFDQYRRGPGCYNCWMRHGSDALANALGYIWHFPVGGTEMSVGGSLAWRLAKRQQVSEEAARQAVRHIRYVAIYDDEPKFSRVFFRGLKVIDAIKATPRSISKDELLAIAAQILNDWLKTGFTELIAPLLANLENKLDTEFAHIRERQDQAHDAVVSIGAQVATDLAQTKMAAADAKDAADTTREAVVAKLIPQYGSLEAVKEIEMRKAVLAVLRDTELPTIDREIIELYYRRNLSQDRIVNDLRRQGRGKTKRYVGKVLKEFNAMLLARGLRAKERVTGEELPPEHGYGEDQQPEPITTDTPATAVMAIDPNETEVATTIGTWRTATLTQKKALEIYYSWLPEELRQAGEQPVTKPK